MSQTHIAEGKALVEELFRGEFKRLELGEPRFEWGPEDMYIRFPVRVTLGSESKPRRYSHRFDRAPLEDRDRSKLSRQVREFAAEIARQELG